MSQLIGHLHPLVVHLPIGFILLGIIIDGYLYQRKVYSYHGLSTFIWLLSALTSIIAVVTGLTLVNSGHYEGFHVFIHRWTAIGIAIVTSLIFFGKWKNVQFFEKQNLILKIISVILLIIAGHKGGEITHGPDFLPLPFTSANKASTLSLGEKDSIYIFQDIIRPVLDAKCVHCHEDGDARGRLNLTTQEGMLSDIFGDPAIMPGNLAKSAIFKRITLPRSNEKFMPPSGPELSYAEIRILEYWINSGASFTNFISASSEIPNDVKNILKVEYGINFEEQSVYDRIKVETAVTESIEKVKLANFNVKNIAAGNALLDVSRIGYDKNITDDELATLLLIKDQITWLDLSATSVNNDLGKLLAQMPNLTKLKLQNTVVGDELLPDLIHLKYLQTLNLYHTQLTDSGLQQIEKITPLKSLYVWQTAVTEEAIEQLKSKRTELSVVGQLKFTPESD